MSGDRTLSELRSAATEVLTDAARLRTADGHPYDMAEFIAHILSSAAANLGDPEALLAGRCGSWEAACVRQLIEGTIGDDPLHWQEYRTEPIEVPLNVAELIELSNLHPGLLGADDATNAAYDELQVELGKVPDSDTRIDEALDRLELHYAEEYRAYGARFCQVVRDLAEDLKLPAFEVVLDVDPHSGWWDETAVHNPDLWGETRSSTTSGGARMTS